ncbi:unnamed protein product, partial [Owenia fusiformis]
EYVEAHDSILQPIKEPLSQSYIKAATSHQPDNRTLLDYMREQKDNEKEAVVFIGSDGNRSDVLTFKDWAESSQDLAVSLSMLGLRPNDFMGIMGPNCRELVCSFGAALNLSAVPVFLSFNLVSGEDLVRHVKECNIRAIIVDINEAPKKDIVLKVFAKVLRGEIDDEIPSLRHVIVVTNDEVPKGAINYKSLMGRKSEEDKLQIADYTKGVTSESPLCVLLTSGSTGKPKYCILPQRAAQVQIYAGLRVGLVEGDRCFNDRPMSWVGGLANLLATLIHKVTTVTVNANYAAGEVEKILRIIQDEKLALAVMLPYMMRDVLQLDDDIYSKYRLSTLKTVPTGGQRIDPQMVEEFKSKTGTNVIVLYGATEMSAVISCLFPKGNFTKQHQTVGYPLPHVEICIQLEDGSIPPVNTLGEICVRGLPIFSRYLNNEARTNKVIGSDGSYHTGDIGTITPYGYITIAGRKNEFIKRGTVIVQPSSIEEEIRKHPDVQQVQVVGVPDPRLYEEVCACIIPHNGKALTRDNMKQWCASIFGDITADGISNAPRYYMILDKFPLTSNGKIDRITLKEEAKKYLKL